MDLPYFFGFKTNFLVERWSHTLNQLLVLCGNMIIDLFVYEFMYLFFVFIERSFVENIFEGILLDLY